MRDIRPLKPKKKPISVPAIHPEESGRSSGFEKREVKPIRPRFTGSPVALNKIDVDKKDPDTAESGFQRKKILPARSPRVAVVRLGQRERMLVGALIVLAVATSLLGMIIFLPRADIKMNLKTAPLLVEEKLKIQSGKAVESEIPGQVIVRDVTVSGSSDVSGTEVIGTKAKGKVRLINKTFSEQQIKGKSRLITSDERLYYIGEKGAIIPSAEGASLGYATVEIEAAEAGAEYNLKAQRLDFAGLDESSQSLVYAEVVDEIDTGSGDTVKVVREQDMESAKKEAAKLARQELEADAQGRMNDGWSLLEESWTFDMAEFSTSQEVGQREEKIDFTARGNVYVMGYEAQALETLLRRSLENRLEDDYMLFPGPISFSKKIESSDWQNGRVELGVRVTHSTIPKLSIDSLKQKLANRSVNDAQEYVRGISGVRSVDIGLWPFWVRSIPRIEKRINLDLQPDRQP